MSSSSANSHAKTATRGNDWESPQDPSQSQLRKSGRFVQKQGVLTHNMCPLSRQKLRTDEFTFMCTVSPKRIPRSHLPEEPNFRAPTGKTQTQHKWPSGTRPRRNKAPNFKVRTARACRPEFFHKAPCRSVSASLPPPTALPAPSSSHTVTMSHSARVKRPIPAPIWDYEPIGKPCPRRDPSSYPWEATEVEELVLEVWVRTLLGFTSRQSPWARVRVHPRTRTPDGTRTFDIMCKSA